jgi:hypothetical protein
MVQSNWIRVRDIKDSAQNVVTTISCIVQKSEKRGVFPPIRSFLKVEVNSGSHQLRRAEFLMGSRLIKH